MSFEEAIKDFPQEDINTKPPNTSYSFWHILEHVRRTQHDILTYIQDSENYQELDWPTAYWPGQDEKNDWDGWQETLSGFNQDLATLVKIVNNPSTDLFAPLPNTPDHTIFREIRIVTAHNSYHIGEFAILRQVIDNWLR